MGSKKSGQSSGRRRHSDLLDPASFPIPVEGIQPDPSLPPSPPPPPPNHGIGIQHDPFAGHPGIRLPSPPHGVHQLPQDIPLPPSLGGSSRISSDRSKYSRSSLRNPRMDNPPLPPDPTGNIQRRQSESGRSEKKSVKVTGKAKGKGRNKDKKNGKKMDQSAAKPLPPYPTPTPSRRQSESGRSRRSGRSAERRRRERMNAQVMLPPPSPPPGVSFSPDMPYVQLADNDSARSSRKTISRNNSRRDKERSSSEPDRRQRSKRKERPPPSSSSDSSSGPARRHRDAGKHTRSRSKIKHTGQDHRRGKSRSPSRPRHPRSDSSLSSLEGDRIPMKQKRDRPANDRRQSSTRSRSSSHHQNRDRRRRFKTPFDSDDSFRLPSSNRSSSQYRGARHESDMHQLRNNMEQLERQNERLRRIHEDDDVSSYSEAPIRHREARHRKPTHHYARWHREEEGHDERERRHTKSHKSKASWRSQAKDIFYEESNKRRFRDLLTTSHEFRQQYKEWYKVAGDLLPYKPPKRRRR